MQSDFYCVLRLTAWRAGSGDIEEIAARALRQSVMAGGHTLTGSPQGGRRDQAFLASAKGVTDRLPGARRQRHPPPKEAPPPLIICGGEGGVSPFGDTLKWRGRPEGGFQRGKPRRGRGGTPFAKKAPGRAGDLERKAGALRFFFSARAMTVADAMGFGMKERRPRRGRSLQHEDPPYLFRRKFATFLLPLPPLSSPDSFPCQSDSMTFPFISYFSFSISSSSASSTDEDRNASRNAKTLLIFLPRHTICFTDKYQKRQEVRTKSARFVLHFVIQNRQTHCVGCGRKHAVAYSSSDSSAKVERRSARSSSSGGRAIGSKHSEAPCIRSILADGWVAV